MRLLFNPFGARSIEIRNARSYLQDNVKSCVLQSEGNSGRSFSGPSFATALERTYLLRRVGPEQDAGNPCVLMTRHPDRAGRESFRPVGRDPGPIRCSCNHASPHRRRLSPPVKAKKLRHNVVGCTVFFQQNGKAPRTLFRD